MWLIRKPTLSNKSVTYIGCRTTEYKPFDCTLRYEISMPKLLPRFAKVIIPSTLEIKMIIFDIHNNKGFVVSGLPINKAPEKNAINAIA